MILLRRRLPAVHSKCPNKYKIPFSLHWCQTTHCKCWKVEYETEIKVHKEWNYLYVI